MRAGDFIIACRNNRQVKQLIRNWRNSIESAHFIHYVQWITTSNDDKYLTSRFIIQKNVNQAIYAAM